MIVLASTSAARRALMDGLGVAYRAVAPGVDEEVTGLSVEQTVAVLAERKAAAVAEALWGAAPDGWVIGADQLVSLDGVALGKPADAEAARQQLESLRGRSHDIVTGVCVIARGFKKVETDTARLTVWPDADIGAYVKTGEWRGCAGGYRVEGKGQALFERIEGDRTSIQGLPMQVVVRLLKEARYRFFF